jgi:hypothetical protein
MSLLLNKAMFKDRIDKSFYYGLGFFGGLFSGAEEENPEPSLSGDVPYDSISEVFEDIVGLSSGGLTPKIIKDIKDRLLPLGVELTEPGVRFLYDSYLDCLEP